MYTMNKPIHIIKTKITQKSKPQSNAKYYIGNSVKNNR